MKQREEYYTEQGYRKLLQKLGAKQVTTDPVTIYVVGDCYDQSAVDYLVEEHQILDGYGRLHGMVSYIVVQVDTVDERYNVIEVRRSMLAGEYVVSTYPIRMLGEQIGNLEWDCNCNMAPKVKQGNNPLPVCRHVLLVWMLQSKANAEEIHQVIESLKR